MRSILTFLFFCGLTGLTALAPGIAASNPHHRSHGHRHSSRKAVKLAEVPVVAGDSIQFPDVLVRESSKPQTATIIVLHGLGQQASVWSVWGEEYGPELPYVKWMWPKAPQREITAQQASGPARPGWYDIISWPWGRFPLPEEDAEGIAKASRFVQDIIDSEIAAGIPSNRIILTGFSQGGALALAKLRDDVPPLAGIVALSTYLPLAATPPLVSEQQRETPVLFYHGSSDEVAQPSIAEESARLLTEAGANVTFTMYKDLAHWVDDEEMANVLLWWQDQLPPITLQSNAPVQAAG